MNIKATPQRIIQISDPHCYADDTSPLEWSDLPVYPNQSLRRLLAHLSHQADQYELLVISGDIVQEETAATYQQVRRILLDFPLPTYLIPGNHDVPELMLSHLVDPENGIYWQEQLDLGPWSLQFLNTHHTGHVTGLLSAQQLQTLRSQLDTISAQSQHALLFMHHHPLPFGSGWQDQSGLQHHEDFVALVQQYPPVKAIAFGHIHHAYQNTLAREGLPAIQLLGAPATSVQLGHEDSHLVFAHNRPAWRELTLHADGELDTAVYYLD